MNRHWKVVSSLFAIIYGIVFFLPLVLYHIDPVQYFGFYFRRMIGKPTWAERRAEEAEEGSKALLRRANNDRSLLDEAIRITIQRNANKTPIELIDLIKAIDELKAQHQRKAQPA